jgi:GT2 family glycosyltransferase
MADGPPIQPVVSVIIPTYRDWDRLETCLHALSRQTYPERSIEVIVVDNDGEGTGPFERPASNVTVLREAKRGSYTARNTGIMHARGDILAFTDSDCIPGNGWIEQAVELFRARPDIHRLGGRVELFVPGPDTPSALYERVFAFQQERFAASGTAVTANMFSRRNVFEVVGLFDGSMESGDDTQWGLRAEAAGYRLMYAPDAVVRHPARTDFSELAEKVRRVYRGRYVINGWHSKPLFARLALSVLALTPPLRAIRALLRNRDTTPREKGMVLGVLVRLRMHQWLEHVEMSIGGSGPSGSARSASGPNRPA